MAFSKTNAVKSSMADRMEAEIGDSPTLSIYSGSVPINADAPATGTLLAEMTLPANWLSSAVNGQKTMLGTWSDPAANASGTATYWRISKVGDATRAIQGECSGPAPATPKEMVLASAAIVAGTAVVVIAFTYNSGN